MEAAIVGIGMTAFGKYPDISLKALSASAITLALADAGLSPDDIEMAFVANSMAAIITGQVAVIGQNILRAYGFSSIPVFNIDNACASSSSALNLAVQAVKSEAARIVLVLGVEKLVSADRSRAYVALNGAADLDFVTASGIDPTTESVFVRAVYPERFAAYATSYGLDSNVLAQIAVKNRGHAAQNPLAQYRDAITLDDVLNSRRIVGPLTALMCAPIGDGASAVIVARDDCIKPTQRPVWIKASVIAMGMPPGGESSVRRTAKLAYRQANLKPSDINLAEVHDSIAFNELLAYEELGFCEPGEGARLVASGTTTLGGKLPVNPSGGLESRGHPVAATGTAQIIELAMQLRGEAGARQVPGARFALAENAGGHAQDDTAAIAITILGSQ
jgi:acetyl-CoA acyltransferase